MGNLTETQQWEETIYQLETSDPVLGGPEGISNRASRQLANRTQWLKQQQDKSVIALETHIQSRNHPDASLDEKGFVQLSSAIDSDSEREAATPKAISVTYKVANTALQQAMDASQDVHARLAKAENLADVPDKASARDNLSVYSQNAMNGVLAKLATAQIDNMTRHLKQKFALMQPGNR